MSYELSQWIGLLWVNNVSAANFLTAHCVKVK